MRFSNCLISFAAATVIGLSGCGGGGGSAGTASGTTIIATTPGTGTTTPVIANPKVSTTIINQSGVGVTSIAVGGGYSVRATVVDAAGAAVSAKHDNG